MFGSQRGARAARVGLLVLGVTVVGVLLNLQGAAPSLGTSASVQNASQEEGHGKTRLPYARRTSAASEVSAVRGRVSSAAGVPLVDAQVCVLSQDPWSVDTCVPVSREGRFEVEFRGSPGKLALYASAREHLPKTSAIPAEDATPVVDFVLPIGGTRVAGQVLDAIGGPIPGASLRISSVHDPFSVALALSDTQGCFVAHTLAGPNEVSVKAQGYAGTRQDAVAPVDNLVMVLGAGGSISGKVVEAGSERGIREVNVTATATGQLQRASVTVVSANDGSFELGELAPGRYEVRGTSPSWRSDPELVALGFGEGRELILTAQPSAHFSGKVLVGQEPCSEGFVQLLETGGAVKGAPSYHSGPVSPHGTAELVGLLPGHYRATANCAGATPASQEIEVRLGQPNSATWELESGLTLGGSVHSADGTPQSGVSIQVVPIGIPEATAVSCRSDEQGRFDCHGLAAGRVRCYAELDGEPASNLLELELHRSVRDARLVLGDSGTVSVHITASNATAQSRPFVLLRRAQRLIQGRDVAYDTFEFFPLGLGSYEVVLGNTGAQTKLASVQLAHDGERVDLELRVEATSSISGQVVDRAGGPVPDAWVAAEDLHSVLAGGRSRAPIVLTDAEGQFTLQGLIQGSYQLRAESAWGEGSLEVAAPSQDVRVPFQGHEGLLSQGPSGTNSE